MNPDTVLQLGGILGGLAAIGQMGFQWYKFKRGGEDRRGQAEAAKAHLDVAQAEAELPHVQKALEIGNVAEAVAVQQGMINGMQDHIRFQDELLGKKDERIAELETRLADRDARIDQLEARLGQAEDNLAEARRMITDLRSSTRFEN